MPRPPVKKTFKLAKAAELGKLQAQDEQEYKGVKWIADMLPFLPEKYKKNTVLGIEHFLAQHAEKIPKGIAIFGMTIIIKGTIDASEELLEKIKHPLLAVASISPAMVPFMPLALLLETVPEEKRKVPDWAEWLVAFTLAYIIIEHGGQIILGLSESVKGLAGLVGFLLG